MKRKLVTISILIVVTIAVGIYFAMRPGALGNMSNRYTEKTTTTSTISFLAQTGDRIKFSFSSNIKSGNLDIVLYDSTGNEVYELDKAKELETFFNLAKSDTYTLAAECKEFSGEYKVAVYMANQSK